MSNYWIVASKDVRDESTGGWESKWTTSGFLKTKKFFPSRCKGNFTLGDKCLLRVFGAQQIMANFEINSNKRTDSAGDIYYDIDICEDSIWDYPLYIPNLPEQYKKLCDRNPVKQINDQTYNEIIGIRNFMQNLRLHYRRILHVNLKEHQMETILDSIANPLKVIGLEIVERQYEITKGNKIDLICRDERGDLVVVEIKKYAANVTIGQLARYLTDVRENYAKPTQKVKGLILAMKIDEQLIKAARGIDVDPMLYQITFD